MMPEKLDLDRIKQVLVNECSVSLFECVDSTNQWTLEKSRKGGSMPFACLAEQQTRGRGRRGKIWLSPPGCNIYMSLAWSFEIPVNQLGVLSIAAGLAVIKALEEAGVQRAMLKWPNDVLVEGKKIAGILIETATMTDSKSSVVIGVGLNYHFPESSPEIPDQPWSDIVTVLKSEPRGGRNRLAGLLLRECLAMCERLSVDRGSWISEFQHKYDACSQKEVSVMLDSGEQLHGIARGVTSTGELCVLIDGNERVFNSAEISLRRTIKESLTGLII